MIQHYFCFGLVIDRNFQLHVNTKGKCMLQPEFCVPKLSLDNVRGCG
jgi:hypothetical protein